MKNIFSLIVVVFFTFLMFGCGPATLGTMPVYEANNISVTDDRSPRDKLQLRDSVLSAIIFFGDTDFTPDLKDYFVAKLAAAKPANLTRLDVVMKQYRVADYFPKRMKAGIAEWVFMPNTNTKIVARNELPTNVDMVICYFEGMVNGKRITAKAVYPYTLQGGSMMVRSDANFVKAVNGSIDYVVASIVKQLAQ